MVTFALGVDGAWAEAKVTVTREENTPQTVEIKSGEEVRFINASGSTAHVWFGGNDAVRFYVGKAGSTVKFEKPGTSKGGDNWVVGPTKMLPRAY